MKKPDAILIKHGVRVGKLLVVSKMTKGKSRQATWECLCDCGNTKFIAHSNLTRPNPTRSCGCIRKNYEDKRANPDHLLNIVFRSYRNHAKNRSLPFDLLKESFRALTQHDCVYCGSKPTNLLERHGRVFAYNGIDRIDNTLGYNESNCVPCCRICNRWKSDMNREEFIEHVSRILEMSRA